jgi:hypothetical protein
LKLKKRDHQNKMSVEFFNDASKIQTFKIEGFSVEITNAVAFSPLSQTLAPNFPGGIDQEAPTPCHLACFSSAQVVSISGGNIAGRVVPASGTVLPDGCACTPDGLTFMIAYMKVRSSLRLTLSLVIMIGNPLETGLLQRHCLQTQSLSLTLLSRGRIAGHTALGRTIH